jgi:hypothetical protein
LLLAGHVIMRGVDIIFEVISSLARAIDENKARADKMLDSTAPPVTAAGKEPRKFPR